MWCQLKMSSNKSNNSPLVWKMGLWSMKTYVPLQVIQCKLTVWEKRISVSQDIPTMSSVLNEKDIHRNVCNHNKAGHQQCAKAISLFPVEMIQMKKGEPENWTKLPKTHVIRHSYSHWSGIAAVLIVEYVLSQKYRRPLPWTEMEWSTAIQLTSV